MSRATKISEDVRRFTRPQLYRCLNSQCGAVEPSVGMRPTDMMKGLGTACADCGGKMEAISGHTSLPGYTAPMSMMRGRNI